jgi:hypothetical protein
MSPILPPQKRRIGPPILSIAVVPARMTKSPQIHLIHILLLQAREAYKELSLAVLVSWPSEVLVELVQDQFGTSIHTNSGMTGTC